MSLYTDHVAKWKGCTICSYCEKRTKVVLARGRIPCDILFIGEAPGPSEDISGQPFMGPAGHLLGSIIEKAVYQAKTGELKIAYTNLVACIPLNEDNKKFGEPSEESIKACNDRLVEFVRISQPKGIVRVGKLAAKHVYGQAQFSDREDYSLDWLDEGRCIEFCDIVHPAAILRADKSQQGLLVQRTVLYIRDFIEKVMVPF